MNRAERAQERRQEGERHVSEGRGAESREGHSAGRTGGASDLRCMDYAPDLQAQGDCINCGWAWEYHKGPRP
jgi:hypothetical protein